LSGKQHIADLVRTGLCLMPSEGPLFGVVSRLVHLKGLDILPRPPATSSERAARSPLGDPETEHMPSRLARSHSDHTGLPNGFSEPMARRIVAASDFCLMPSRFESCGLTQMQA
jgi:starch synthase